jgi:S1-C subfamily serine protease
MLAAVPVLYDMAMDEPPAVRGRIAGPAGIGVAGPASPQQPPANAQPGQTFSPASRLMSPVSSAGFAIPINDLLPVINQLKAGKPIVRGWLGIDLRSESLKVETDTTIRFERRVLVSKVYPDSPAARAGVLEGDYVVTMNGRPMRSIIDMRVATLSSRPGDTVAVTVQRGGSQRTLNLHLIQRPTNVPSGPIALPLRDKQPD